MYKFSCKKIINIDKKYIYHNFFCNKKNTTFFHHNNKIYYINTLSFKNHSSFQSWIYFSSKIFGLNKNIIVYLLSFIGCHRNIIYTDLEEYVFMFLKCFLKHYNDYFSLSWYLTYLKERSYLLPLLYKGNRYIKKLPSRGQRTRSNYENCKNRKYKSSYNDFKKRLTNIYKDTYFPSWKKMENFYFHRY